MNEKSQFDDLEESSQSLSHTNRGIKLIHPGRKLVLGRPKAGSSGYFANHLQAIQAVQQQQLYEQQQLQQQLRGQQFQQQFVIGSSNSSSVKKVHPLQRQFLRSRSAFIRPVR